MKFNGYECYITDQDLPHLESPWTKISVNDKDYYFQKNTDKTKVFSITGYIEMGTWEDTRSEAEGLNNSLNTTPSGVLTDGYGTTYSVLVESHLVKPVAAVNRYTFSMSFRML
jgi:hypothetical protein